MLLEGESQPAGEPRRAAGGIDDDSGGTWPLARRDAMDTAVCDNDAVWTARLKDVRAKRAREQPDPRQE